MRASSATGSSHEEKIKETSKYHQLASKCSSTHQCIPKTVIKTILLILSVRRYVVEWLTLILCHIIVKTSAV